MKRRIFSLIAALCCLILFALPASAARRFEDCIANCKLYDPDNLFSPEEQEELSRLIRQTSDDTDVYVAVCIINDDSEQLSDDATMQFADDRYDELFNPQADVDTDGVLLVLNMPTHYICISTSGMGELYYSNSRKYDRISIMVNNLKDYLRSEQNVDAVRRFCTDVKSYNSSGAPYHAYTRDRAKGLYYYEKNGELVSSRFLPLSYVLNMVTGAIGGLIIGGLTMLITVLVIKSRYKFRKSLSASNYISDKETTFYQRDDMFIRTHTTKTYIDRSSSGGGGGGGGGGSSHSSSGGHSHGGGGGHW